MRTLIVSIALTCGVLLALAACAPDSAPAPTPTPAPPTATPLPRGGTLSIRIAEDIPKLQPWQPHNRGEEQTIGLLYNGLMRLDSKLQPQPDLAESWQASADGRLITMTLRPNLVWHDGEPLTADDAAFTLQSLRELSPTTALIADLRRIADISVPTTRTLAISLTERYAPILSTLALPVLPQHLLRGKDFSAFNFWSAPIGSGPFRFAKREDGVAITLEANKTYFRGEPLLDRIALVVAPDPKVATTALGDGRLDLAELPWDTAQTLTSTVSAVRTGSYPENGYYFLAFNTRENRPFGDARVRQALSDSVDLAALVKTATDGQGIPIANSAVPSSWADFGGPLTQTLNLDRARTLLDEAGWALPDGGTVRQRDGQPLQALILVRADDTRRVAAAEAIAKGGATIGISLTVQPADFDTVIRSKYLPPYDFDLLIGSWSNGAGDPQFSDSMYYDPDDFALFHSSQVNQGTDDPRLVLNFTGFNDAVYDEQATAAHQLYNQEERSAALRVAQSRIGSLRPYLFLWDDRLPVALSTRVATLDGPVDLSTPMYLGNIERWFIQK